MKNRSSVILIAVLLALSVIALYIYNSRSTLSTVDNDDRSFSFKDTAAITRIFIADKQGHQATLKRTATGWVVNDKYNCRTEAMLNLLEAIKHVEVKTPLDKATRSSVLKFMSANAYKVEIYTGNELAKQYYVGHETPDSEGSYMLLTNPETGENYGSPYACFLPGFKGYLAPRFIVDENEWRDRVVINYIPPQLKSIAVKHLDVPADSSFSIDLLGPASFRLKGAQGNVLPFDEARMKQYLAYFQNISYEALITGMNKHLQDSLAQQKPFCIITLNTVNDGTKEFKFYRQKYTGEEVTQHGVHYTYDPNHLYLRFDRDKEWALIQYYVFGKLLATPLYFLPAPVKK